MIVPSRSRTFSLSTAGLIRSMAFGALGGVVGFGLVLGHKYNVMGLRKILPADE